MEGLDQHLREHIALGVGPDFVKEVKEDITTLSNRINNIPRGGGGGLPSGLVLSVNGTKPDTNGNVTIAGGSGIAIGDPVTGGTANRLLYVNASTNLAQASSFDGINLDLAGNISAEGYLHTASATDLTSTGGRLDLLQSGDMLNIDWALYWNGDDFISGITTGLRVEGFLEAQSGLSTPSISGLTTPASGQVAFVSSGSLIGDTNFTYNGTTDQLSLGGLGSSAGIVIGGDTQLFRGAADRLDLATGDSLYILNGINGLAVGTAPSSAFTASVLRNTTGAVTSNDSGLHVQMTLSHGNAANFPGAARFRSDVSASSNTVLYHSAIQGLSQVTNSHSGTVSNLYGADFSARWNTQQATAVGTILIGGNFAVTADAITSAGTVGTIYGGQFAGGLPAGTTGVTFTGSINAGRFIVTVPGVGASAATASNILVENHTVGASGSAISNAAQIRLRDFSANYTSGSKYPILFESTANDLTRAGIWWGTDANNVGLGRIANNTLGLASGDSFQLTAGNLITDTTTGTQIATSASQKLGFWGTTPVVRSTGWSVTNLTTDRSFNANATTLDEIADVLGTLIEQLKTYGILAA